MIRLLSLCAALAMGFSTILPAQAQAQTGSSVAAQSFEDAAPEFDALFTAMGVYDVLTAMAAENVSAAAELEDTMFPGQGGAAWAIQSMSINSADRIISLFQEAFDQEALSPEHREAAMGFLTSAAGERLIAGEVAARTLFLDDQAEEAAGTIFMDAVSNSAPRLELLERFNEINDLVERNVMGALNASFAFYQGLADGGAFETEIPEDMMVAEVWSQEADMRRTTVQWLYSYQLAAYADASDEDLEAYVAMSASEAGQALNAALFAAFDEVFVQLSYELGTAAAYFMASEDI